MNALLFALALSLSADPVIAADLVLVNGKVWTVDAAQPQAQAIAVWRGRILKVGTDADVSGGAHVGVRLIPHTELRLGYTALYYKLTVADVSVGSFQRTMISSQSLHGPEIGLGIVF